MFKVGDKVKIIGTFKSYEESVYFNPTMSKFLGREGVIQESYDFATGKNKWWKIVLDQDGDIWTYPEYCLELVKQKHPQAEFIKAWLDGAEVEASEGGSIWFPVTSLVTFNNKYHFRIKPKSQVLFASLIVEEDDYYKGKYIPSLCDYDEIGQIGHNLKLTIENGELVNVQLIKQSD